MKLPSHRVNGRSDWDVIPAAGWNIWQKTAARSLGIATVGNFFSVLGLSGVILGLIFIHQHRFVTGSILLLVGRICDLLDGQLADLTGTKSPLGEKIDATVDKISTGLTLILLTVGGVLPYFLAVLVALPHTITAVMALDVFHRGSVLHPSKAGKLSMAAAWAGLFVIVIGLATRGVAHSLAVIIGFGVIGISIVGGGIAVRGYFREYRTTTTSY